MKHITLFSALSTLLTLAPLSQIGAQVDLKDPQALKEAGVEAPKGTSAPKDAGITKSNDAGLEADATLAILKKLKPEQQEKVMKNVNEASSFIGGIRLQEALSRLEEVDKMAPGLFMVSNLRGAVYTKMRLFDKATESFAEANRLNPGSFQPKFNLAEIDFVNKRFDKALPQFASLVAASEAEEKKLTEAAAQGKQLMAREADLGTRKLIEFKIVICQLKLNKVEDAKKKVAAMSYLEDSPLYYMSNAAIAYHAGKKEEAQEWVASANRIFDQGSTTVYVDSFVEMGWIETLTL